MNGKASINIVARWWDEVIIWRDWKRQAAAGSPNVVETGIVTGEVQELTDQSGRGECDIRIAKSPQDELSSAISTDYMPEYSPELRRLDFDPD